MKGQRLGCVAGGRVELGIGRFGRVLGERRENVGEEQLLVLLLVVDAEFDQRERIGGQVRQCTLERFVDVSAPFPHFVERRTAEHPALRPSMPLALRLVIAVEEVGEALVIRAEV